MRIINIPGVPWINEWIFFYFIFFIGQRWEINNEKVSTDDKPSIPIIKLFKCIFAMWKIE